jgi:UDP-N-acetylglucosamine--N-acetylmuramyl-(pentapeptide) pyrophosphoryl-undecaprenol N-acetylglucosamine transferase
VDHHPLKILFAAGGTGGHLFPAIAIAEEIESLRPGTKLLFVGTQGRIESRVVPMRSHEFITIWISGFQRRFQWSNLVVPLKIVVSLLQSLTIISRFRPRVVVGTGSYVAGPVLFAASLMRIPVVVHESNSYPGITTKMLARRATRVFLTYDETKRWLARGENVETVGNPTRNDLQGIERNEALTLFGFKPGKKTVLVFGGSLGAASINAAVGNILSALLGSGLQIIWQTGARYDEALRALGTLPAESVWARPFIDTMGHAYAAADLVVCRAGATTLAELTRLGKPAILVPYPHAAEDHQTINARTLVDAGAAELIFDHELNEKLRESIIRLVNDARRLGEMSARALKLGRPNAGRVIAEKIIAIAES